jgi:zinc transport system ATP-binding protein
MNLLTVKDLSVQIERKLIIENLSFELAPGEKLSVVGPNGAGKTILLRALLRLVPYSGEISWAPDVKIGYVPQKLEADRHLPLTYKDLFAAKCRTINAPAEDITKIGASVGLTKDILETPVGHLSGGQFQRGLIGFALIGQPNVLLLDEPTASIDEPGEEHIYELISRLEDQFSLASIMVSHDLSFVSRYATRVLCLNKRSVCIGSPQVALSPEVLRNLYGESYSYYQHTHD